MTTHTQRLLQSLCLLAAAAILCIALAANA